MFDAKGFQQNRDYFSALPFERIDTAIGALTLTFTDLVLPGNAGHDLRFVRSYNSKDGGGWRFGLGGIVTSVTDSGGSSVGLFMADSGEQVAAIPLQTVSGANTIVMTDRFWKYDRSSKTLSMPDGSVGEYDSSGRLTTWTDVFDNQVTVFWQGNQAVITQTLGSQSRQVTLDYPGGGGHPGLPTTMTFNGRVWSYVGAPNLTQFDPPGPNSGWYFDVAASGLLVKVTTGNGGRVEYDFEYRTFSAPNGGPVVTTKLMKERRTYERDGSLIGTWKYRFLPGPSWATQNLEIEAPSAPGVSPVITTFEHSRLTADADNRTASLYYSGRLYVVTKRTATQGGQEVEHEDRTYRFVPVPSTEAVTGSPADEALPEPETQTITRGGQTYATTFSYCLPTSCPYFGNFHNPWKIEESGESGLTARTTEREFLHSPNAPYDALYLVGKLTRDTVTVGGASVAGVQSFTTSWDPDPANGFIRSETRYGIATTFAPDAFGNVASATNANNKTTSFTYQWGRVKNTSTPEYLIEREINSDGTVASEKIGGRTTTYTYDDLARIKEVHPPAGGDAPANPIITDYDNAGGAWVRTKRGEGTPSYSQVVTTLDGFGRPIATEDNANVHTRTAYDAEGRVSYQSLPFTPGVEDGDVGTTIAYDGLGRVRLETHADGTVRQYTYSGNTLTVTDENTHNTVISRQAFGNPDEVRVASVTDAYQQTWTYQYNAVGSLERVTAPNNAQGNPVIRQWVHDARNLLQSETHPESGTVLYPEYYPNGTLKKKTDAKGTIFTYEYDDNDRLKKITAGSDVSEIWYEQGSDNRATMTAPGVLTTFLYDDAGRLKKRTDTIGGAAFDVWSTYDGNGNLATLTYPSGRLIRYHYTLENRLREIRNDNANQVYASTFEYHPSGAVKKFQSGNNVVTEIKYNKKRYWVDDITIGSLRHFTYSLYDNVGNVGQIDDARPGLNQTFTFSYDNVDRLATTGGAQGSNTFTYDAHGNRQDNMVYDPQNPFRLQSFNGLPVSYDNNGNLEFGPQVQFDYTRSSVLERSVVGGVETHFRYDADDWRVKKEVTSSGAPPTYFVRAPNGQLLTEWRNSAPNAEVRDFIYAGSRLIAVIKATSLLPR